MRTRRFLNLLAVLVLVILSACSARPSPTPSSSPTTAPTLAPVQAPASKPVVPTTSQPAAPTATPLPTPTRAPLPPTVVSVTPDRGEEAALAAPVVVTFDQPMDPATTRAAFAIEPKVKGEVKVQGNALTFSPAESLQRKTAYRVTLAESATSAAGLPLQQPVCFQVHHHRHAGGDEHPAGRRRRPGEHREHDHGRVQPAGRAARRHRRASGPAPAAGYHPHADRGGRMDQHQHLPLHAGERAGGLNGVHGDDPGRLDGHHRRCAGRRLYFWLQHGGPDRGPLAAGKQHQCRHRAAHFGDLLHADGPRHHRGGVLPRG